MAQMAPVLPQPALHSQHQANKRSHPSTFFFLRAFALITRSRNVRQNGRRVGCTEADVTSYLATIIKLYLMLSHSCLLFGGEARLEAVPRATRKCPRASHYGLLHPDGRRCVPSVSQRALHSLAMRASLLEGIARS